MRRATNALPRPAARDTRSPATPAAELRVLLLSHMDPRLSNGGAEIAAFQMYEELKRRPGITAFFLSCAPGKLEQRDGVSFAQPFGTDNFCYASRGLDHFTFSNPDHDFTGEFGDLLRELRPDVIYLNHYTNFGVEALLAIRRTLPDVRIILTLHEYLAICNHFGQMVKRPGFGLCERSGPRECNGCFPEHSVQDFFLRELFIKRFFRLVDHFVAPSRFLADRYVAWGLEAERISVVENGVPGVERRGHAPYPSFDDGLTVGFFGQISQLKGIDVLLDAAELLARQGCDIKIEVHGDHSSQPPEFQAAFLKRVATAPPNFDYRGRYDNRQVDRLMQRVHAVLVPSIWWENSPLVIQEALANRRPVICSDIGGMAEKVRDGIDGFHFQAGSGWALAALLRRLAGDHLLLLGAQARLATPPGVAETTDAMLALGRRIAAPARRAAAR